MRDIEIGYNYLVANKRAALWNLANIFYTYMTVQYICIVRR